MPIQVRKSNAQGNQVLPNAETFTPNGTKATIETSDFDGVLEVGERYWIQVTAPSENPGTYTANYVDVDVLTYSFNNLV